MFSGAYFARPNEVKHEPNRMFYKREVVGVEQIDRVESLENVQARCAILTVKQYEAGKLVDL